jgi:hypothetical protein
MVFWLGQTLSTMGDAFAMIAFPLLILQASGSLSGMGVMTACFGVGSFCMGLFSGVIVDRVDRRRLMIGCDLLRALLFALVPLCWWTLGPSKELLYFVAVLGGALGNLFMVSSITAVASLVSKEKLTQANGRLHATIAISFLTGPLMAGLLSSRTGPEFAIAVDAVSFLLSALALFLISLSRSEAVPTHKNRWQEMSAGFRFLWSQPVLRWLTILLAGVSLLAGVTQDLLIFEMKQTLRLNDDTVGLIIGIASSGSLVGAIVATRARHRFGFSWVWLTAFAVQGTAMLCMTAPRSIALYMSVGFAIAFSLTARGVLSITLRQEVTPPALLGRVTAAFWLILYSPGPIGAALLTRLAEHTGVTTVYVIIGVGILGLWLVGLLSPVRSYQDKRL